MFLPVTIIKEHTPYANTYFEMIRSRYPHPDDKSNQLGLTPFYFKKVGENYISAFPLITPILAVPVYFFPLILGMKITWGSLILLSHLSAAVIVAFSGGFLYLLLKKHLLKDEKKAKLLTMAYLFGTINFALISQALWQHGTLELFIILTLYAMLEKRYLLSGIFLGLAVLSRPTALILVPFYFLILISQLWQAQVGTELAKIKFEKQQLKQVALFILGVFINLGVFIFYTQIYYHGIANNGYSSQVSVGWLTPFPKGFLGLWFSPSKGILVYSPIFIFIFFSIYIFVKDKLWKSEKHFIYLVSLAIILTHTLVLGAWKHWYGGWSFGYRMASDVIPFMILALVPFMQSDLYQKFKKLFALLLALSIGIEIYGMIFFDGIWHAAYDLGYKNQSWLWSIKNSEFVFNMRRILVKLNLLERACPTCQ
jgi:Gpi18-like mannosyltransferase